jgi:ArsR family transcriptional regulator
MGNIEAYFKGLADLNRLRIINLLQAGELCGCDIQYVIQTRQSNVSRHLTYLKHCGLVQDRREGYRVYYRLSGLDSPSYKALIAFLKDALNDALFVADRKRLARAVKEGACRISEMKPTAAVTASGLQSHMRR